MRERGYDNAAKACSQAQTKNNSIGSNKSMYTRPVYDAPITLGENLEKPRAITPSRPPVITKITRVIDDRELPKDITDLIDDKAYLPKHKKLARDYGLKYQLKLVELAKTKDKPSSWFAKVTAKKNWEARTLPMLEKLLAATETAKKAIQKLGLSGAWLPYYIKVAYRSTEAAFNSALEQAQTSAKTTPQYYFRYLSTQI